MDAARGLKMFAALGVVALVPGGIFYWDNHRSGGGPADLEQGAKVIQYMSRPINLKRSSFAVVYPDSLPSEFVSYIFSEMGSAEWPDREDWADETMIEQARAVRMPLTPADVAFVAHGPDPDRGRQLVVMADDDRRVLIVEGYTDPAGAPTFIREYRFKRIVQSPDDRRIAEIMIENRRDLGGYSSSRR